MKAILGLVIIVCVLTMDECKYSHVHDGKTLFHIELELLARKAETFKESICFIHNFGETKFILRNIIMACKVYEDSF